MAKKREVGQTLKSPVQAASGSVNVYSEPIHPSSLVQDVIPAPMPGIPVAQPKELGGVETTAEDIQAYVANTVAKMFAKSALDAEAKKAEDVPVSIPTNDLKFQEAVEKEVRRRLLEIKDVGVSALSGLDCTPTKDSRGNKLLMYVNRNKFPIFLPHPNDPGSYVDFPPCPDKTKPLGMKDFRTHTFFANFVGFKRSVSQEPVPAYLNMSEKDIEGLESVNIHDLMKLTPEDVSKYVEMVSRSNPDVAAQISRALSVGAGAAAGVRKAYPSPAPMGA